MSIFWKYVAPALLVTGIIACYVATLFSDLQCAENYQFWIYAVLNSRYTYAIVLFAISCLIIRIVYRDIRRKPASLLKNILITIYALVMFTVTAFFFYFMLFVGPHSGIGGGAAHIAYQQSGYRQRQSDLSSLSSTLLVYSEEKGSYPLKLEELISSGFGSEEMITDPVTGQVYQYGISEDRTHYILGTILDNPPFSADCEYRLILAPIVRERVTEFLENDIDGELYGIQCEDPVYCINELGRRSY